MVRLPHHQRIQTACWPRAPRSALPLSLGAQRLTRERGELERPRAAPRAPGPQPMLPDVSAAVERAIISSEEF